MRAMFGQGTPREAAEALKAFIFVVQTDAGVAFGLIATVNSQLVAILVVAVG